MSFRPFGRRRVIPVPAAGDGGVYTVTLADHFDSHTAAKFTDDNYTVLIEGHGYVVMESGHKTATRFDVAPLDANHLERFTPSRIHIIPDFDW